MIIISSSSSSSVSGGGGGSGSDDTVDSDGASEPRAGRNRAISTAADA